MTTATLGIGKIDPTKETKHFKLTPAQTRFVYSDARHPAYVGGWGTGKTLAGIARALRLSSIPKNLGMICRKEYTDLKDSTAKDFQDYTGMKIDGSRNIRLPNGSEIMFRHLEELNNLQNINLGWFWIEQAEELDSDEQFFKLFGRLRRTTRPHSGFITANTNGHNWIYRLWKTGALADQVARLRAENPDAFHGVVDPMILLIESKTMDNKENLPPEFLAGLELLKASKPKLYNRFVENSWEESDTIDIIIQPSWVMAASRRSLGIRPPIKRVVSIDVARYGDDKTVFYAIENNKVLAHEEHEQKSTMETVGLAQIFAKKHNVKSYAVDEIGVGSGVVDRLMELGLDVVPVNSAKESRFPEKYYNLRAEIYGEAADLFQAGKVEIEPDDEQLIEQLSWAKYKSIKSNGVYQVEAKEDIKKRFGRSPDNADCFLNGLWALDRVQTVVKRDAYAIKTPGVTFNPDVV